MLRSCIIIWGDSVATCSHNVRLHSTTKEVSTRMVVVLHNHGNVTSIYQLPKVVKSADVRLRVSVVQMTVTHDKDDHVDMPVLTARDHFFQAITTALTGGTDGLTCSTNFLLHCQLVTTEERKERFIIRACVRRLNTGLLVQIPDLLPPRSFNVYGLWAAWPLLKSRIPGKIDMVPVRSK